MGGISFLNPGLLLLTAAAVLPLLIWLLAKRKPKRVIFSSLRFIKAGQEQEKKKTRLKNIILLLIRMLIILLVTLAATRPLLQTKRLKPAAKHPPTAIAVILDTSFSMDYVWGAKTNLERGKEILRKLNSLCTEQDRLILICSDEAWNRLHAQIYAGQLPDDLIEQISVTHAPLGLDKTLAIAEEKLRETQLANRELYFVTDGQIQNLTSALERALIVINVNPGGEFENLSCSQATVLPQLVEKTRRQTLQFRVTNHGNRERRETLARVVLGEVKVAEKFIDLPARNSVNQSISLDLPQEGWQTGYVEIVDDRLEHDNRSHFSFPFHLSPRLAVLTDNQQIPQSLRSLLQVYTGPEGRIDLIGSQQASITSLQQYQGVVILSSAALTPKLREIVAEMRTAGKGALFCLDGPLTTEQRAWIGSIFGVSIGTQRNDLQTLNYINPHHFTSSLIAGKSLQMNQLSGVWQITGSGSSILLGNGGIVFAMVRDNILAWNFSLDARQSSFLLDSTFPVFGFRCLEFTSATISSGERRMIGDVLTASKIVLPDGQRLDLAARRHLISQPGIYQLIDSNGAETPLAVDADERESAYEGMDYKTLKNVKLLADDWEGALFHTRLGHDLWKILLAAALALIILELILVKTEELRPGAENSSPTTRS